MRYTVTFKYEDKQYIFQDDYEYQGWDEHRNADYQVTYMYTKGNYSCDCNRSDFIGCYCEGAEDFPDMKCGDTIQLVSIMDKERQVWPELTEQTKSVVHFALQGNGLYLPVTGL